MRAPFLLVFLFIFSFFSLSLSLGCVGETGDDVDWWIILKSPIRKVDDPNVSEGLGYAYIDSVNIVNNFELNARSLNDEKSPLVRTLSAIYGNQNLGYLMYNDQPPNNHGETPAHAKGVMGFDNNGAFWLIHSLPHFPVGPQSASSPQIEKGQRIYGQSMICLSLSVAQVEGLVAKHLNIFEANFYESSFPSSVSALYPNLHAVVSGTAGAPGVTSFFNFTSSEGVPFFHFAKNGNWGQDLYANFVSPFFRTGLMVETWMRPHEDSVYPPNSQFEVVNVNTVSFPSLSDDFAWEETSDHSKWAISTFPSRGLFCIGDINKQQSQHKRGGGTLCGLNCNIYSAFLSIVKSVDKYSVPGSEQRCKLFQR